MEPNAVFSQEGWDLCWAEVLEPWEKVPQLVRSLVTALANITLLEAVSY